MTNHPRRKAAPFTVDAGGELYARTPGYVAAHDIAQHWSRRFPAHLVEVIDTRRNGGIVGQYQGGTTTPEFESYPPAELANVPTLQDAAQIIRAFIAVMNTRTVPALDIVRLSDAAQAFLTATRL
jgi:hypothetical protein